MSGSNLRIVAALAASVAIHCVNAHADTGITISGRIAAGVDYVNHIAQADGSEQSLLRAGGNQWGTSLLDIGGEVAFGDYTDGVLHDAKGVFLLESGFDATKGTTNGDALFNRRAYVGISSRSWGTVLVGRDQSITNDIWDIDPHYQAFISTATLVRGRNWFGAPSMIEYRSRKFGGLEFGVQTALGEQQGSSSALRKDAASVTWSSPTWLVRGIYDVARDRHGSYSDPYLYSREAILGGVGTFGALKVYAGYDGLDAPDAAPDLPSHVDQYWLGAHYDVTKKLQLTAAGYSVDANRGQGNALLLSAGMTYNFTSRLFWYAMVGNVSNGGHAEFSVEVTDERPLPGNAQQGSFSGLVVTF